MDDETRTIISSIAMNTSVILAGIVIILLELDKLGWGVIFALAMVLEGSFGYALGYDGLNRRLWEWVGGYV